MRMLFNHGLTPEELYVNTPNRVIDKNWKWFIDRYGTSRSYWDSIAAPFKYCFGLIINKVLEDRVRFKLPTGAAYIDFEIIDGDTFIKQKQNGRFSDIDFIESDFTSYFLRYYFKGKAYQKSYPIYLGGELKKKFINGINSGIKYYSIKDITIYDFIDEVHAKFKELTKLEIKRILIHGFRRMNSAMIYGCAISINTSKYINCLAYIGKLSTNPETQIKEYSTRMDRKLRKISNWNKTEYNGYYYIGLVPSLFKQWVLDNKCNRNTLRFNNIRLRRLKEEFNYKDRIVYVFKIKIKKYHGWSFWKDKIKSKDVEYLGMVNSLKFIPSDKTWKELIKEYETTSN